MNDKDYNDLLEVIKIKRKEMGISQEKMADILGLAKLTYQRYENGVNSMPMNIFMKLSKILDVDLVVDNKNLPATKETLGVVLSVNDISDVYKKIDEASKKSEERDENMNKKLEEILSLFNKKKK